MQTLQVEDITTGRENTRLYRAVDAAAALAACGFRLRYKKLETPSKSLVESTWFVDAGISEAHNLLLRAAIVSGPESLIHRSPEHPCLAALWAIRNLRFFQLWLAGRVDAPAVIKPAAAGRLCCLRSAPAEGDLMLLLWASERPQHRVPLKDAPSVAFVAAAASCGFLPYPRLTGEGIPCVHVADASLTFAGLRLPMFYQPRLPESPADGQHPFKAALAACLTWLKFTAREEAERRRSYLLRSKYSLKTALVSAEILDESNGEAAKAREQLDEHLAAA